MGIRAAGQPSSGQASGFDIYACLEDGPVTVGQRPVVVPTGIAMEVPWGLDAQFRPRSGLARQGVLSTFGTLDADYRGEIMITLYTVAPDIMHMVQHGDRIEKGDFIYDGHPGGVVNQLFSSFPTSLCPRLPAILQCGNGWDTPATLDQFTG